MQVENLDMVFVARSCMHCDKRSGIQTTRTQQRRERHEKEEVLYQRRLEQELASLGPCRGLTEIHQLQQVLEQHGLQVFEIPVRSCQHTALFSC
jgi:hypothetical protein